MISVDNGTNTEKALREVCEVLYQKGRDHLFLISIAEDPVSFPVSAMSASLVQEQLKAVEKNSKAVLIQRARLVKSFGIEDVNALLGHGNHVGEAICKAAKDKNIDFLVVGRRGVGKLKRMFLGSTSKYILENSPCNVICIKEHEGEHHEQELSQQEKDEDIDAFKDFERLHLHV
eukprot:gene402-507_t